MKRRKFNQILIGFGAKLLLGGSSSRAFADEATAPAEKDDETIVTIETDDEAGSLEQCLLKGNNSIPFISEFSQGDIIKTPIKPPALVYVFDAKTSDACEYKPISVGFGTILTKNGFVITVYHDTSDLFVEEEEEAKKELAKNRIALMYDPATSVIRKLKLLSYSKKDKLELALCKMSDVPRAYNNFAPTGITKGKITQGNLVYGIVPGIDLHLSKGDPQNVLLGVAEDILRSVKIYSSGCNFQNAIVEQINTPPERNWGWTVMRSRADYTEREEDHTPFFYIGSKVKASYSGMALLSAVHNDITGLLMKESGLCTGPENIRAFVTDYIYKSIGRPEVEATGRSE